MLLSSYAKCIERCCVERKLYISGTLSIYNFYCKI
uniref:Uncharacterized protein n=1 Tax=Rhizophora mucronata TaxID=61149 RepID=A0A2P2PI77_RHIMU